jgi:hypothetical protein
LDEKINLHHTIYISENNLEEYNLNAINTGHRLTSTASDKKDAKIQYDIS